MTKDVFTFDIAYDDDIVVDFLLNEDNGKPYYVSRIIIASDWEGNPNVARSVLNKIYEVWSTAEKIKNIKVKFLMTCGGFLIFDWPNNVDANKKDYSKEELNQLVKEAEKCVNSVILSSLADKLSRFADYLTIGIDSYSDPCKLSKPHIELVFIYDLKNKKVVHWTGKSYPTVAQEKGLIKVPIDTHFLELDSISIMVLGCHDLKVFEPRTKNRKIKKLKRQRGNEENQRWKIKESLPNKFEK